MEDQSVNSDEDGTESAATPAPVAARRGSWLLLLLPLLAFAVGVVLTILAMPNIERRWRGMSADLPVRSAAPVGTTAAAPAPAQSLGQDVERALDSRVVQLEERLNHVTVEAQAASGNAVRAEGLLVAFAARRALDSGTPLGYIEGQMRLRFGQAQPRAVATIVNAAREPVTLADLRGGLLDIAERAMAPAPDGNWWDALEHEARELVTIRKASTPSPRPQAAMDRAVRAIDAGRVGAALAEVERMPGRSAADRWMQSARQYLEARRALDLIETAAILEPRQLRGTDGAPVSQTSPLAP
ncbi:hypothetical protein WG907_08420 [Sphingobium sp. AN558]|uniref:hypothetical protein n=1 Tax=Sphingobium sp. AN558 TaxID=3133442 RepID=UPI0030BF710D